MAALKACMLLFTAFFFSAHIQQLSAAFKVRGNGGGHRTGDRVLAHVRGAVRHRLRAFAPSVDCFVDGLKTNKLLLT
ncbi:hypothetical protein CFC21_098676 [Triticum aestivum]|uniref:Uncharacterized protein n=4 Tax=Triticum TaxID=4564 RepID=A0A9R1BQP9_TRITD|nr:hypothetical protein TRIUR3_26021 [Triticum urartu]KAF7096778.1 hypothetical protein CFC21_098676 [Triticum aestivum]VAI77587.1 unnamed protein product [Triticum turgidum subsp. durum]